MLHRAEAADLAARREWQTLLHYRPTADGAGVVSDADDPRFFLAPTGKTDPDAELAATLRAFFSTDAVGGDPQPAQCAFIARYRWLKRELEFDDRRLPPQSCERFQHWFHELNAESATLVFTSAYLNNPASLFGHTLLRLDRRGQTEHTRLLAYAINYAANDTASHGLMYAVDGITGGFKGTFDLQPYYKLVRTYSDLESRDLWEYRLNLSPPQLQRLLEHVWELREIQFDYYFFRENCAWQLLTLLEVADPTLRLSDEFTLWALPPDTIRLLVQQPGLVGAITARPARGTVIRRRYQALHPDERRLAQRLTDDPAITATPAFAQLAPERQALLLELVLDQRLHRRGGKLKGKNATVPVADEIAHQLLTARNRLAVAAAPVVIDPYATQPETGHTSRRIGFGFGQRNGTGFVELNARASYHDLLEPDAGYTPDAQIELLNIAIRYYQDRNRLKLDRLTVLDITSLPPVNALSPRPAWRIHVGWEPYPRPNCPDCTAFNLSGGLGLAAETGWRWRTLWFALPGLAFDYGGDFAGNYRAGLGMTAGTLLQPLAGWKVLASVSWLDYRWGETGTAIRWSIGQNLALGRDWALRADWRALEGTHEFGMGLRIYF
ncbi:conserved hypothetical protein [Candidatus Contendobacter odensis Run_B_J11]|uniref:DUF4105 domain-containing protein n=1 Tax=Candidatus Contendobacter odensis Run_B_J11 TaxID=1400861 RepID=A0A7U7J531_9GAMM|nr:conserved hypothetical protein [Candidatus Contendobacter odensis Run_B_J11]